MTLDLNKAYIYNFKARNSMVGLVQLVRALVCGTRNHGFESHIPPQFYTFVLPSLGCSQGVRHGSLTPAFAGPNPATPAIRFTSSVGRALDF